MMKQTHGKRLQLVINNTKCPYCGGTKFVDDNELGERVCTKCATVFKTNFIENQKLQYEGGPENARTGQPTSIRRHDMGLSTVIGITNKDASGKGLSAASRSTFTRLRTWDARSQTKAVVDRNLKLAMAELDRIQEKLTIPDNVATTAAHYYREVLDRKLTRGRSISVMVTSCLYAACRMDGVPRTLNDFYKAANLKKKDIAANYRLILKELELVQPVVDSTKCISRIASNVNASEKIKRKALHIIKLAQDVGETEGKDPMGIASAALYLAVMMESGGGKPTVTQRDISLAAEVTEVTIRNRLANLKKLGNIQKYVGDPIGH